ncbi:uncharacterized protein LOC125654450 isoform X3 [Ostrea edulis]|nr:uncharacterized protein LOC125654450 isoform X3 [Ostrea edulis]XP_056000528.1 uncharacterized protein LOC125654450 isoform X3 [Ostrea edulis]
MTNGDSNFDTRYRLLDFSNYSYSSPDNDKTYQRILSFPCFIGFQRDRCQPDNYKVYKLTMKSFSKFKTNEGRTPFTELSYNITIYNYYVYHPDKWKSTIAVAFFPGEKDVTFLFDPAPVSVKFYNVSLFNVNDNTTYRHQNIGQLTKHCFKDVMDGTYHITIMVESDSDKCTDSCSITKSHVFTVGNPKPMQSAVTDGEEVDATIVDVKLVSLAVGGGVALAFTLLATLCYLRWKNRTKMKDAEVPSRPKVLLIYSNIRRENANLAKEFANISKEELHIDLIYDKLVHEIPRISAAGYGSWYNKKLEESSAAIILWTPGSDVKERVDDDSCNAFNTGVTLALNSKTNDDKKLMCIYFDKSHKRTIPRDIQKEVRVFAFPAKSSQLSAFLHGKRKVPKHAVSRYTRLEEAILAVNQNNSNNETVVQSSREETTLHVERTEDISEETLDEEISELKEEFLRKNTGNLSHSSNSSASTAENPIYNPSCPIHGHKLTKHQGNTSIQSRTQPERFSARVHKNHPADHFGEQGRVQSCQHPFPHDYPMHIVNSFPCHERDRRFAIFDEGEEPDEYQALMNDSHEHHNNNILHNIHDIHPDTLLRQNIAGEEFSHPSSRNIESSFRRHGNDYRRRSDSLQRYNEYCDTVSEHTPLKHPTFYLEDDGISLQPSLKSGSLQSMESNCTNYSKRSDSISSLELKLSLQKFI